jgi:hypothetical protein
MKTTLVGVVIAVVVLLYAAPLIAHHSFAAEFDVTKPIVLKGTLTKVELTNPHSWLYLNVRDEKTGKTSNWAVETSAPTALLRAGGDKKTLAVGTQIIVDGWLARDGSQTVNGRTIKTADGKAINAGSSNTNAATPQ